MGCEPIRRDVAAAFPDPLSAIPAATAEDLRWFHDSLDLKYRHTIWRVAAFYARRLAEAERLLRRLDQCEDEGDDSGYMEAMTAARKFLEAK